jgi:hypothetical protein
MTRIRPPDRRSGETFEIVHDGMKYSVMVGRVGAIHEIEQDGLRFTVGIGDVHGAPIEVFVAAEKTASALEALARDGAILISFALQYGASLDELRSAVTRGELDLPATVIGAVLDAIR